MYKEKCSNNLKFNEKFYLSFIVCYIVFIE